MVADRIRRYWPINHWGPDLRYGWIAVGLMAIGAAAAAWQGKLSHALIRFTCAMFLGAVLAVVDYYNLLLGYELWQSRGMPLPQLPFWWD